MYVCSVCSFGCLLAAHKLFNRFLPNSVEGNNRNEKSLIETQTLRAGCSKVGRGAGRPRFNQLEMVTTFTYRPSFVRIDACNLELSSY